jgi:hypothetical protein
MAIIITPCLINMLEELAEFAEANPLYLDDLLDMINGSIPVAGDTKGYYIIDPFGTKIVYTIEIVPEYKLRHLSISMNDGLKIPPPAFAELIMTYLGFKYELGDPECIVDFEERQNNPSVRILNVAEKITD